MSLELRVLGCDGGYPGPGGAGSGYLLRGGGLVGLDLGPGTLARLQQVVGIDQLDALVVSHEHPDHCSDLEGLAVALHFADRPRRLRVLAPAGVADHRYFREWDELEWEQVGDGDSVRVGEIGLRFSRTDHAPETLAVMAQRGGATIAYSADTGPGWSPRRLRSNLDLLLCEATWTAAGEGLAQHLSGRQAGQLARAAGVRRLVVTHRWPTIPEGGVLAEARKSFGGQVESARAGATFTVSGAATE